MNGSDMTDKVDLGVVIAKYEEEYTSDKFLAHSATSEHLESYRDVLDYLASKGSKRMNFRHYATRKRIASILDNSAFYLTDGSSWNDEYNKKCFNSPDSDFKKFGMCLSATTGESIAMWMLYGGTDGNGAMINFDRKTLAAAAAGARYECGYFEDGEFKGVLELDATDINFSLVDVLYFNVNEGNESAVVERVGEKQVRMGIDALNGLTQIAKHRAWSYEAEVRFVATVSKLKLYVIEPNITAIKIPIEVSESFIDSRVFDSPVSDDGGEYRDSELRGTVEWDLCKDCARR